MNAFENGLARWRGAKRRVTHAVIENDSGSGRPDWAFLCRPSYDLLRLGESASDATEVTCKRCLLRLVEVRR